MLDIVKLALRYRSDVFDSEIETYINSCKNDLTFGGVKKIDEENESFISTVIAYCKWQLNFQGQGEKWEKVYRSLKTSLVLNSDYH